MEFLSSTDPSKLIEESSLVTTTSTSKVEISGGSVEFKMLLLSVDGYFNGMEILLKL